MLYEYDFTYQLSTLPTFSRKLRFIVHMAHTMASRIRRICDHQRFITLLPRIIAFLMHVDQLNCLTFGSSVTVMDNYNVPCKYMDSIATTDLEKYARLVGDVNYTRVIIDANVIGYFDYEILNNTFRQPVDRHQRVCVCKWRPCIRLLCPRGMTFDKHMAECVPNEHVRDLKLPILAANGVDRYTVSVFEHFGYTEGKVCDRMFPLTPDLFESDAWELTEV